MPLTVSVMVPLVTAVEPDVTLAGSVSAAACVTLIVDGIERVVVVGHEGPSQVTG